MEGAMSEAGATGLILFGLLCLLVGVGVGMVIERELKSRGGQ